MRTEVAAWLLLALAETLVAATPQLYRNPLFRSDSPDPGAIYADGVWYAATTGCDASGCFPLHASANNLSSWSHIGYVFLATDVPVWAHQNFWAPEIHLVNGRFLVVFTARQRSNGVLAIGIAVSLSGKPFGPFKDPLFRPLFSNGTEGSIDATIATVKRPNKPTEYYLVWKDDGNDHGRSTPFYAQKLCDNGTAIDRERDPKPHFLITNDRQWEGVLIEAPWIVQWQPDLFFLFFSGSETFTPWYGVGVAVSSSVVGPYKKSSFNPILRGAAAPPPAAAVQKGATYFRGPGHCSVLFCPETNATTQRRLVMIYHAEIESQLHPRVMMQDAVQWVYDPVLGINVPWLGTPSARDISVPCSD